MTAATFVLAAGAAAVPLGPGDRIGAMRLARATGSATFVSMFDSGYCDPLTIRASHYHRHCTIPRVRRLLVNGGDFAATLPALDRAWRRERWRLRIDGHEIRLAAFGTADTTLYSYPPGSHRNSILRAWRVALVNPTPGRHLIRYLTYYQDGAVNDVTWTVTVR